MSAAPQAVRPTRIFGVRVGVDPKILVGGLIAVAAFFLWFNLRGGDDEHGSGAGQSGEAAPTAASPLPISRRLHAIRRSIQTGSNDRETLRVKPVDGKSGTIDPTLRLGLLARLQTVALPASSRNLFDSEAAADLPAVPKGPILRPAPLTGPAGPTAAAGPAVPTINVPFKYYGFVRPSAKGEGDRGFFMEGDNILVATEGDVLDARYLIVALNPETARVEDIQLKQGQELAVTPEAAVSAQ